MYKPLPEGVTIRESALHGLGLFATSDISEGVFLGTVHFPDYIDTTIWHRTPLGGFGNHSETPNCDKIENLEDGSWGIRTNQTIFEGDEITWYYTFYDINA